MKPADVLHVGDRYELDVAGAVNAGLKVVQIDRALLPGELQHYQINTLARLTAFIRKISSAE